MKKIILALMLLMPLMSCSGDKFNAENTNKQLMGQWVHRDYTNAVIYKYVFSQDFTLNSYYNSEGSLVPNYVDVKYTLTDDNINLSTSGSIEYRLAYGLLYLKIGGSVIGFSRN